MALSFFVFCNLGIVLGYLFIGFFLLPNTTEFVRRLIPGVDLRLHATTWGGVFFFLTCAGTHLEHALHVTFQPGEHVGHLATQWHMMIIHGVQVVAVWTLILGVLFEFVWPVGNAIHERTKTRP